MSRDSSIDAEVVRRVQAASAAFGRLRTRVWSNRDLRLCTKIEVYRAVVVSALTYSLETCTLYRRHMRRLTAIQMYHLRLILGISWQDRIPNVEVLRLAAMTSIEALLVSANIRWAGHVVRMDEDRLPKAIMYSELAAGARTVGGQKLRYKDVLKRNLKAADGPVDSWEEVALDRTEYRRVTRGAVESVEENRRRAYEAARERRHNPPPPAEALLCPVCNKVCRGRVGLAAHTRARHR